MNLINIFNIIQPEVLHIFYTTFNTTNIVRIDILLPSLLFEHMPLLCILCIDMCVFIFNDCST